MNSVKKPQYSTIIRAFRKALTKGNYNPAQAWKFAQQLSQFTKSDSNTRIGLPIKRIHPKLDDHSSDAAEFRVHYTNQDLHVANRIFKNSPTKHLDVGSSINGFICHVASFREVEVLDIRPFERNLMNITFHQVDLMNEHDIKQFEHYTDSLSCLHTLEHFGLGRYGDPIDAEGHISGFKNMARLLRPEGTFYLSVPIGEPRTVFNAHRVFSIRSIQKLFTPDFDLTRFSYENDQQQFFDNVNLAELDNIDSFRMNFGCGIFELKKKKNSRP